MTNRQGNKVSELTFWDPFWVRPRDWVDWMLNVNQIRYSVNVSDGFGGTISGNGTSNLTKGDPLIGPDEDAPTIYKRERRWIPKGDGDSGESDYLDAYDFLRTSLIGNIDDITRTANPFPPNDAFESSLETNTASGSYGSYGVEAWRDWPDFENDNFATTAPVVTVRNNSIFATDQSLWRKVWEEEDRAEGVPNPGWRYQIPFSCSAGVGLGWCGPVTVITNFNPAAGPVPWMPIYESVLEGADVLIGGNSYGDEVSDPQSSGDPPTGYREINVDFTLTALSGAEYTIRPRLQSGLGSARTQIDPDTRYNDGTPFNSTGIGEFAAYSMSGQVRIDLEKV